MFVKKCFAYALRYTKNRGLLFLMLFIFSSCKQNPLEGIGPLTDKKPTGVVAITQYGVSISEVLNFYEGKSQAYPIDAWVPEPGRPLITIIGLPNGIIFDSQKLTLSWTPPYDAANDPLNPSIVTRTYEIEISLQSDIDQMTLPLKKKAIILVHDTPRNYSFDIAETKYALRPGVEFIYDLKVLSEDFPRGPFFLESSNLPTNASVTPQEDASVFRVRWVPWHSDVSVFDPWVFPCKPWSKDFGCHQKTLNIQFKATNLKSQKISSPLINWVVSDLLELP